MSAVIGRDALSTEENKQLEFLDLFHSDFMCQGNPCFIAFVNSVMASGVEGIRSLEASLDLAWDLLRLLPKGTLTRIPPSLLDQFYQRQQGDKGKQAM